MPQEPRSPRRTAEEDSGRGRNKEESVKDVARGGGKDEDERERKKKGEEDPHIITLRRVEEGVQDAFLQLHAPCTLQCMQHGRWIRRLLHYTVSRCY